MFWSSKVSMCEGTSRTWYQVRIDILHTALCSYNLQSLYIAISGLGIQWVERKRKQFFLQHCVVRCCPWRALCEQQGADIAPETLPKPSPPNSVELQPNKVLLVRQNQAVNSSRRENPRQIQWHESDDLQGGAYFGDRFEFSHWRSEISKQT